MSVYLKLGFLENLENEKGHEKFMGHDNLKEQIHRIL